MAQSAFRTIVYKSDPISGKTTTGGLAPDFVA
jgi:hypothetical protein